MTNNTSKDKEKLNKVKKLKKVIAVSKLIVLIGIIVALPVYIFFFHPEVFETLKDLTAVRKYLEGYKTLGLLIYLGVQIIQIVIAAIPGQAVQLAAGYLYGVPLGFLVTLIGVTLGSIITFYLARLMGKEALFVLFGKDKLQKFIDYLNSKHAFILVFIIYLIPGIPKDLFNYAAGVSDMSLKAFLIISLAGRTPGIIGSLAIGAMYESGSYTGIIILGGIAVMLFALGIIYWKKVIDLLEKFYLNMSESDVEK